MHIEMKRYHITSAAVTRSLDNKLYIYENNRRQSFYKAIEHQLKFKWNKKQPVRVHEWKWIYSFFLWNKFSL